MSLSSEKWEDNEEIQFLQEYLRIPSVHPHPDYNPCVEFLKRQAESLDLPLKIYHPVNQANPIVILTWKGRKPGQPSILLNSHMDVVPVFPDNWTHPPFDAHMDSEGRIFARGAQDMKSVGMQYLGAIRDLRKCGLTFERTIHISFVPDEEMGGGLGMRPFVKTPDFQKLNVGFSLDEGMASPTDVFPVFYAERSIWRIYFKIHGSAGHGSLLLKNTVGEKMHFILNKMMAMRQHEVGRLENNPELTIGDVTTINVTKVSGGVQSNVIPPEMMICFDVRLAIDVDHADFESKIHQWCKDAGGDITLEYDQKRPRVEPTVLNASNPYWLSFKGAVDDLGLKIKTQIFTGGTDSRYIRELGIPALGFSPMNNTPVLLHDHNEYVQADNYLQGIEIYKKIITRLANTPFEC